MQDDPPTTIDRRFFLQLSALAAAGALWPTEKVVAATRQSLVRFPEKTDLILLTDRPPQLETPIRYFLKDFTPNEAFFVRWHMAGIPTQIDTRNFRLSVGGQVHRPLSLSLNDLHSQFESVSLI